MHNLLDKIGNFKGGSQIFKCVKIDEIPYQSLNSAHIHQENNINLENQAEEN